MANSVSVRVVCAAALMGEMLLSPGTSRAAPMNSPGVINASTRAQLLLFFADRFSVSLGTRVLSSA